MGFHGAVSSCPWCDGQFSHESHFSLGSTSSAASCTLITSKNNMCFQLSAITQTPSSTPIEYSDTRMQKNTDYFYCFFRADVLGSIQMQSLQWMLSGKHSMWFGKLNSSGLWCGLGCVEVLRVWVHCCGVFSFPFLLFLLSSSRRLWFRLCKCIILHFLACCDTHSLHNDNSEIWIPCA